MTVTKKSIIGDVLDAAPDTAAFFFEIGMHCLGCPSARGYMPPRQIFSLPPGRLRRPRNRRR